MTSMDQESLVSRLVDAARCVVGANVGVKSITVVANRRLRYDELARLRAQATACNADFVVGGDRTVVVRQSATATTAGGGDAPRAPAGRD